MTAPFPDSPWFNEQTCRQIARERRYGARRTARFLRSERARTRRTYQRWIATGYLAPSVGGFGGLALQARRRRGPFAGEWCPRHMGLRGLRASVRLVRDDPIYDRWRLRWVR